jgi:hypothetical protein
MKDKIAIIFITLVVFLGGLITGVWTQKIRPSTPPRIPIFGEFLGNRFDMPAPSQEEMEKMEKEMEAVKPEMETYMKKISGIQDDFREKVRNVLREDQKPKWDTLVQKRKEMESVLFPRDQRNKGKSGPFFSRGENPMPMHEPQFMAGRHMDMDFMGIMIYKPILERLSKDLSLDSNQQTHIEKLLHERRQKIIELVDQTPPPSISMGMEHRPQ